LDKYEVTVGRFAKFVAAWIGDWRPPAASGKHIHLNSGKGLLNPGGSSHESGWNPAWESTFPADDEWDIRLTYYCQSGPTWGTNPDFTPNHPINCLSWYMSYAFCIWDGGFLPSEAEWNYAAAGGNEQRRFPWGSNGPGSSASLTVYDCYYKHEDSCSLAPVGSAPGGLGRWGHLDLSGNIDEWNLDAYLFPYASPCQDCAYVPTSADSRVVRGGAFDQDISNVSSWYRGSDNEAEGEHGMRCARSP
jgi:formylglycine-generating enzyme required for sulfatase activity